MRNSLTIRLLFTEFSPDLVRGSPHPSAATTSLRLFKPCDSRESGNPKINGRGVPSFRQKLSDRKIPQVFISVFLRYFAVRHL